MARQALDQHPRLLAARRRTGTERSGSARTPPRSPASAGGGPPPVSRSRPTGGPPRARTRPPGRPPGPVTRSTNTSASPGRRSTRTVRAGSVRFTRVGKCRRTRAPSSRLTWSDGIGKTLNVRRAVIRNDSKLRPSRSWSTAACTAVQLGREREPQREVRDAEHAGDPLPDPGEIGVRLEVQDQAAGQAADAPHAAPGRRLRRFRPRRRRNSGRLPPFRLISW